MGDPAYKEVTADYKANKGIWDIKAVMMQERLDTLATPAGSLIKQQPWRVRSSGPCRGQHRSVELLSQHQLLHCSQKRYEQP